jgi:site-specific DNA-cytosine methylase
MRTVDLFSGIGGFTWGLRGITTTVAYCELDEHACTILQDRMKMGDLPLAPVCNDVKDLTKKWLKKNNVGTVDMLTAGFPQQARFDNGSVCVPGIQFYGITRGLQSQGLLSLR